MTTPRQGDPPVRISALLRMGSAGVMCGLGLVSPGEVRAACDDHAPTSGTTVTCTSAAPNPDPAGVVAVAGSSAVTVDIQADAALLVPAGPGVQIRDQSTIINGGSIALAAGNTLDATFAEGSGNTVINNGSISTAADTADGIQTNGSANTLTNGASGTITTNGVSANGIFVNGGSGNFITNAGTITVSGATSAGVRILGGGSATIDNGGSIVATATGGAGVLSDGPLTLINATGAQIAAQVSGTGVSALAGGSIVNDGAIIATGGTGVLFGGSAAGTLVNRGTISGTTAVAFGAGDDRFDMLAGTVTGPVTMGDGNDTLVASGGQFGAVDQGAGADRVEIGGTAVGTGTVQQGIGNDVFVMTGGQLAVLLQGDNTDDFTMSAGHIVGVFEDGDIARMTGGRIGRVDMRFENNVFDMSGGQIDGNLIAGLGNDTITLSDGYIGGNISVSSGADRITITGGTVRGRVLTSFGSDTFTWDGGGIVYGSVDMGPDNDTALLRNLHAGNLGAVPSLHGGVGVDTLVFDNVITSGMARFVEWETVNASNGTQLTFDGSLALGDASGTGGTFNIDTTSTVFAGGNTGAAVLSAQSTAIPIQVNNAGRIDLTNGGSGPADTFTVFGNYAGSDGVVFLETTLASDGAPSDKLVISGGTATGQTGLSILNAGGEGAQTLQDGILVVEAIAGATTASGAFALYEPVAAGAFEYLLFKGGVSAGSGENWYLRSSLLLGGLVEPAPLPLEPSAPAPEPVAPAPAVPSPPPLVPPAPGPDVPEPPPPVPPPEPPPPPPDPPPPQAPIIPEALPQVPLTPSRMATLSGIPLYRIEAPTYAVIAPLGRELSLAALGTFHERQGQQGLLQGEGAAQAAWARAIGQDTQQTWRGTVAPSFDGSLWGVQVGVDVYAREGDDGRRDHFGMFLGQSRADGDVRGTALAQENLEVGRIEFDSVHLGLYWSHITAEGGYVDAVFLAERLDGDATSRRGIGIGIDGDGATASVELGYPIAFSSESKWSLEPQVQLIWQHVSFDGQRDRFARIAFESDDALTGRFGLRLARDVDTSRGGIQSYLKANVWHRSGGEDRVDFNQHPVMTRQATSAFEFGGGVVARLGPHVDLYVVADYTHDLGEDLEDRETVEANLGVRVGW